MSVTAYPRLGENLYKKKLSNGLTVMVDKRTGFTRKLAYFVTDFGAIHTEFELEGRNIHVPAGIAHFLEHKMFDLPGERDVSAELAALGAGTNAFTSYDMTAYYISCTENFEPALKLLLEFVSTPYFTEESVQKEIGIICSLVNSLRLVCILDGIRLAGKRRLVHPELLAGNHASVSRDLIAAFQTHYVTDYHIGLPYGHQPRSRLVILLSDDLDQPVILYLIEDIEFLISLGFEYEADSGGKQDGQHDSCRLEKQLIIMCVIKLVCRHAAGQGENHQEDYDQRILELIQISQPQRTFLRSRYDIFTRTFLNCGRIFRKTIFPRFIII